MEGEDKQNLLRVLKEVEKALKKNNPIKIKELSNQTIHTASSEQDLDSISVAVVIYALSKLLERRKYTHYEGWDNFFKNYKKHIHRAIQLLEKGDEKAFRKEIESVRDEINKLSGKFKKYIQDVFRKAQINKASRIYEHGISMQQTASLLGITLWELAEYAGQTGISDVNLTVTMPIKKRLRAAEEIFK